MIRTRSTRISSASSRLAAIVAASISAASLPALAGAAGVPLFEAPFLSFNSGIVPFRMAAADLNGDGRADLAVSHSGNVSVLLTQPDGSFAHRALYSKAGGGVALGDLDGDGKLDLVVTGNGVTVFRGNGDDTFNAASTFSAGQNFGTCVLADMNRDGRLDVVAFSNPVGVLLGNGAGGLNPVINSPPSAFSVLVDDVAVGDFNHDGNLDAAVPHGRSLSMHPCWSEFYGNGLGGFGSVAGQGTCGVAHPFFLSAGDLNGDGFAEVSTAPGLADLNADGRLDMMTVSVNNVTVSLGVGDGSFFTASSNPAGRYPREVIAADFDGDGRLDLAATNSGCEPTESAGPPCEFLNSVAILHGHGDGTFGQGGFTIARAGAIATELGDLNGDGRADLVTLAGTAAQAALSHGNGAFDPPIANDLGGTPARAKLADLDRDGDLDLVVAKGGNSVAVLSGHGDGTFDPRVDYAMSGGASGLAVADLDRDGDPDVVAVGGSGATVRLGDGAGGLGAAIAFSAGPVPLQVAAGDLTSDGVPDLFVTQDFNQNAVTMIGNGNGTFHAGSTLGTGGLAMDVALADLDRDGRLDAVFPRQGFDAMGPDSSIKVLRGRGDGTFDPIRVFEVGVQPNSVVIADVDLDGVLDIVSSEETAQTVSVSIGNGDATFRERVGYGSTGIFPARLSIGDVNADGRPDVAVANVTSGTVTVLLHRNDGPELQVNLAIDPKKLKIDAPHMHKPVNAILEPPAGFAARDIDVASVRLQGSVARDPDGLVAYEDKDHDGLEELVLGLKRSDLDLVLPEGEDVPVTAQGTIGAHHFVGSTTVEVRRGHIHHPAAGEHLTAGQPYNVEYEVVHGAAAPAVMLLVSRDGGETWTREVEGAPNDGTLAWTPGAQGTSVMVAVVEVESIDGNEVIGVLGVSGSFDISDALGAGTRRELGFAPPAPNPGDGPVRLRFGLAHHGFARLAIHDLQGRLVRELFASPRAAGWSDAVWDGSDASGRRVKAGIYLAEFQAEGRRFVRRVARLR
jgi:hypothetical protein